MARFPAESLVATVRRAARELIATGDPASCATAFELVEGQYRHIAAACPVTENLRPWQLLASDLAAALEPVAADLAERALDLADEIRAMVVMIARNPVDELAHRPASRRVLIALEALGGRAELADVRRRSGHSPSHLSNILKPLRAHGLIEAEPVIGDRRLRWLALTPAGRAALASAADRAPTSTYEGYLEPAVAGGEAYMPPQALESAN